MVPLLCNNPFLTITSLNSDFASDVAQIFRHVLQMCPAFGMCVLLRGGSQYRRRGGMRVGGESCYLVRAHSCPRLHQEMPLKGVGDYRWK